MSRLCKVLGETAGCWKLLTAAALTFAMSGTPCSGQLYYSALSVTARPFQAGMDCSSAPPFCQGRADYLELGTYEFDIQLTDAFEIREARFSLTWPPGWTLVEWSNCTLAVITGDVTQPGTGIHLTFDGCQMVGTTVLRMLFDCTQPGYFAIEDHPTEGEAAVLSCVWQDDGEWYVEHNWWPHVEIGDYCGRAPENPCSICDEGGLIGGFGPNQTDFDLEVGHALVDTILVSAPDECSTIPECGIWPVMCYSGTYANAEWIQLRPLNETWLDHWIERTITAEGMEPGTYSARITIPGGETCCGRSNCEEITLTVREPSPVKSTSWGLMKWKASQPRKGSEADTSGPELPPSGSRR